MADTLGELLVRVRVDASQFQSELERVGFQIQTFQQQLGSGSGTAAIAAQAQVVEQTSARQQTALAAAAGAVVSLNDTEQNRLADLLARADAERRVLEDLERRRESLSQKRAQLEKIQGLNLADTGDTANLEATQQKIAQVDRMGELHSQRQVRIQQQITDVSKSAADRQVADLARVGAAQARQVERFEFGALRGAIRTAGPALGIPVPLFGGAPFIAGAVAVAALAKAMETAAGSIGNLNTEMTALQKVSGGTLEAVARLHVVSTAYGIDNKELTAGLQALASTAATNGTLLANLGASATDAQGRTRPLADVFNEVRDRLSEIRDPATQAALAQQLFGASADALLPLLRAQNTELDHNSAAFAEQTKRLKDAAIAAAEIKVAADSAKAAWQAFTDRLAQNFGLITKDIADEIGLLRARAEAENASLRAGGDFAAQRQAANAAELDFLNKRNAEILKVANTTSAPKEIPSAGITTLQKLSQEAGTSQIALSRMFTAAAGDAQNFTSAVQGADGTIHQLSATTASLAPSLRGIASQFDALLASGTLGGQTQKIIDLALKLHLDEASLREVFLRAEGIAGLSADQLANVISGRLSSGLGAALEEQIVGPLQQIEDEATSLQERLSNIGQSAADRAQRQQESLVDAAAARAERLKRLADEEADHQQALADKQNVATAALGQFNKAELEAFLRSREQETAFFPTKPGTSPADAVAEARYQRNRQRELAQEAATEAREDRQAARQAEQDARATAQEAKEAETVQKKLDAIAAAHPDIESELAAAKLNAETVKTRLQIAVEEAKGRDSNNYFHVFVSSPDGSLSSLTAATINEIFTDVGDKWLAQKALAAKNIVRAQSGGLTRLL